MKEGLSYTKCLNFYGFHCFKEQRGYGVTFVHFSYEIALGIEERKAEDSRIGRLFSLTTQTTASVQVYLLCLSCTVAVGKKKYHISNLTIYTWKDNTKIMF